MLKVPGGGFALSGPTPACCALLTGGAATPAVANYIPLAPALRRLPRRMTISGDLGVCRFNFAILKSGYL